MSKTIAAWFSEFRFSPAHMISIFALGMSIAFAAGNYKSQFDSIKTDVANLRTDINALRVEINGLRADYRAQRNK